MRGVRRAYPTDLSMRYAGGQARHHPVTQKGFPMQPPTQQPPRAQLQRYFPLFGGFFVVAGITSLLPQQYLVGVAFLCASGAFLIYWRENRPWAELPRWKRLASLGLIFVGAVCVVIAMVTSFGG